MDKVNAAINGGLGPRAVLDAIPSILFGVALDGSVLFWNKGAELAFGVSSGAAIGKNIEYLSVHLDWNIVRDGFSRSVLDARSVRIPDIVYELSARRVLLGFTVAPLSDINGFTAGFLLHGSDVTEKRNLERQIIQSSKMATVGEMAAGIAHEMNQPLNIMKIAAQRLDEAVADGYATEEFTRERAAVIMEQIDRLSGIISHLRVFGRSDEGSFTAIDMRIPIRNAFSLLGEQLKGHGVEVAIDLPESLPFIAGNSARLEQVFINLIVNSRDALSGRRAESLKKISVSTRQESGAQLASIVYSDNGPGIPEALADRIFEPFFTTKEAGQGTGLGLSISAGIITEHGGSIRTEPCDTGARFIIQMPTIKEITKNE